MQLPAAPSLDLATGHRFHLIGPSLFLKLEQQPGDYLVSKQRGGAFIGTSVDEILRKRGVTQVFLTVIATSAGVEATARSAHDYGYNVVTVVDAMTDLDPEAHQRRVQKIFPRLSETRHNQQRAQVAGYASEPELSLRSRTQDKFVRLPDACRENFEAIRPMLAEHELRAPLSQQKCGGLAYTAARTR